jgi:NAD(P)-dependent dehydrogenase (short-subunit alcohol dehydrogenase family)
VHIDVTDDASVEAAMRAIEERDGHLDVLVNNAGIRTVAEGARVIVRLATIGKEGPTGTFQEDDGELAW